MKRFFVLFMFFLIIPVASAFLVKVGEETFLLGDNRIVHPKNQTWNITFIGASPQGDPTAATISIDGELMQVNKNQTYGRKGLKMYIKGLSAITVPYISARITIAFYYEPTCSDGLMNGDERGIDCGGACPGCQNCTDRLRNQGESDFDCGGPCDKCMLGKVCKQNSDCNSTFCYKGVCSLECTDNVLDLNESDIDCGGSCEKKCDDDQPCNVDLDCISGYCSRIDYVCEKASCSDKVRNQDESDVDCGGGSCTPCDVGKQCTRDFDCMSNYCDGICKEANCNDSFQNQGESDLDCGGPCRPCIENQHCESASDCKSSYCSPANLCSVPSCNDGFQNQGEQGVDCDGPCKLCEGEIICPQSCLQKGKMCECSPSIVLKHGNLSLIPGQVGVTLELEASNGIFRQDAGNTSQVLLHLNLSGQNEDLVVKNNDGTIMLCQEDAKVTVIEALEISANKVMVKGNEIKIMPIKMAEIAEKEAGITIIDKVILSDSSDYMVFGQGRINILLFIPVTVEKQARIDVATGRLTELKTKWWSFIGKQ